MGVHSSGKMDDMDSDTSAPFANVLKGARIRKNFGRFPGDIFIGVVQFAWFHQPQDKPKKDEMGLLFLHILYEKDGDEEDIDVEAAATLIIPHHELAYALREQRMLMPSKVYNRHRVVDGVVGQYDKTTHMFEVEGKLDSKNKPSYQCTVGFHEVLSKVAARLARKTRTTFENRWMTMHLHTDARGLQSMTPHPSGSDGSAEQGAAKRERANHWPGCDSDGVCLASDPHTSGGGGSAKHMGAKRVYEWVEHGPGCAGKDACFARDPGPYTDAPRKQWRGRIVQQVPKHEPGCTDECTCTGERGSTQCHGKGGVPYHPKGGSDSISDGCSAKHPIRP